MQYTHTTNMFVRKSMLLIAILMVALPLLAGCSGKYGRLAANPAVKMQVENFEVLSDHNYYYRIYRARPRVIIGIQEAYTLQSKNWIPVELTSEQLKGWIASFGTYSKHFPGNNGSDILNEDGFKIGVWYAFRNWKDWAHVRMIDEQTVSISTPINRGPRRYSNVK